jgi:putative transposase
LSDAEWSLICPSFEAFTATWDMRRIVDAILYRLKYAVPWRAMPVNFPPWQTVYWHFRRFVDAGLWERLNFDMVVKDRERCGREAQPTAAIADSQTVKATESRAERAYDGGTLELSGFGGGMLSFASSSAMRAVWTLSLASSSKMRAV